MANTATRSSNLRRRAASSGSVRAFSSRSSWDRRVPARVSDAGRRVRVWVRGASYWDRFRGKFTLRVNVLELPVTAHGRFYCESDIDPFVWAALTAAALV